MPATERLLLDAARRLQRQPAGLVALVLHLSRLPGARAHHRRIARAMMQDVAQRQDGQVFMLRNGDLVLLCRAAPRRRGVEGDLGGLPATLARLMRVDALEPDRLIDVWQVAQEPERLLAYATARLAETVASLPAEEEPPGQVAAVGRLAAVAAEAAAVDMMQRQNAVLLAARAPPSADAAAVDGGLLRPLFCELSFSMAALEARAGAGLVEPDPFLFRHLASRLDQRMLELVAEALGGGGPLDPLRQQAGAPPLHLNLALPAILSDGFAALAAAVRATGVGMGVEVAVSEACGDPDMYRRAAAAAVGATLVLDGVSHLALLLSQPWALGADLIKLDWSPRLLTLGE